MQFSSGFKFSSLPGLFLPFLRGFLSATDPLDNQGQFVLSMFLFYQSSYQLHQWQLVTFFNFQSLAYWDFKVGYFLFYWNKIMYQYLMLLFLFLSFIGLLCSILSSLLLLCEGEACKQRDSGVQIYKAESTHQDTHSDQNIPIHV